jgi:hypothetical protein
MVANAEGRVNELRLTFTQCDTEHHAELSYGARQVDLHAVRECRSFRPLLFTSEKIGERHAALFILGSGCESDFATSVACALHVFGKESIVEEAGARPARLSVIDYPSPSVGLTGPYSASKSAKVPGSVPRRL